MPQDFTDATMALCVSLIRTVYHGAAGDGRPHHSKWFYSYALGCALVRSLCCTSAVEAAGISPVQGEAGRATNVSVSEVTSVSSSSSVTVDPADMTLEEYRKVSGGALPPVYSLAAAAVGAGILIITIIIVSVITVIRNRFCSKLLDTPLRRNRENSIDQSKASTSSTARPITLKQKTTSGPSGVQYHPVAMKDKAEVTFEMTNQICKKSDLEYKSSNTSMGSVTPRDQYESTRSLPTISP